MNIAMTSKMGNSVSANEIASLERNVPLAAILGPFPDGLGTFLSQVPRDRMKEVLRRLRDRRQTDFADIPRVQQAAKLFFGNNKENEMPTEPPEQELNPANSSRNGSGLEDAMNQSGSNSSSIIPSNSVFTSESKPVSVQPGAPVLPSPTRRSVSPVPQPVMSDCSIVTVRTKTPPQSIQDDGHVDEVCTVGFV